MSKIIATYCNCIGSGHRFPCTFGLYILLKHRICRENNIVNYIPEEIAELIDKEYLNLKEDFETIKNQYDKLLKKYKLNE